MDKRSGVDCEMGILRRWRLATARALSVFSISGLGKGAESSLFWVLTFTFCLLVGFYLCCRP